LAYYFIKSKIPKVCPKCGAGPAEAVGQWVSFTSGRSGATIEDFVVSFSQLLNHYLGGFHVSRKKRHPLWQIPCYKVSCMNCVMYRELTRKDYFLNRVPVDNWKGGSISVPYLQQSKDN